MNYIKLDYELINQRELKGNLFKLYLFIYKYSSREGYCWVSNKRLAEDMGLGVDTIKAYIYRLKGLGLIECTAAFNCRQIVPLINKKSLWRTRLDTEILTDKSLSAMELRLYALICMWSERGYCVHSNRLLEGGAAISDRSLKKYLSSLEKKGFIARCGKTKSRKIIPLKYLCGEVAAETDKAEVTDSELGEILT